MVTFILLIGVYQHSIVVVPGFISLVECQAAGNVAANKAKWAPIANDYVCIMQTIEAGKKK